MDFLIIAARKGPHGHVKGAVELSYGLPVSIHVHGSLLSIYIRCPIREVINQDRTILPANDSDSNLLCISYTPTFLCVDYNWICGS